MNPNENPNPTLSPQQINESPKPKKSRKILILLIILLLFITSFVLLGFQIKSRDKSPQKSSINNQQITQQKTTLNDSQYGIIYEYTKYKRGDGKVNYKELEKKLFYANPDGSGKKEILNYSNKKIGYTKSPNQEYQIKNTDNKKLELVNISTDASFTVEDLTGKQGSIYSAIWSDDNSHILYAIYEDIPGNGMFGNSKISFYLVKSDGSEKKLVGIHDKAQSIVLMGVNLVDQEFYWIETGEGGFRNNFTIYDMKNNKIKAVKDKVPQDSAIFLSPNFKKVYTSDYKSINEYDLETDDLKMLYEFTDPGKDEYGNIGSMYSLFDKNKVYFSTQSEPSEETINYVLDFSTGKIKEIFKGYEISPKSISPDGKLIWYSSIIANAGKNLGSYYIYDTSNKKLNLFLKANEQGIDNDCSVCENINFKEWVKKQ